MDHADCFVWDLDPILLDLGPLQLRYYGIIFASMLYIGFLLWRWQMLRGGHKEALANKFLLWGVIAVMAGARLGHCFFYEPARYLADPVSILYFWKGGLSSHGATAGLAVALVWFARRYRLSVLEVMDRFAMSAAVGAAAVRLGNFFNSEVVGRATDAAWAVCFPVYDCHALKMCPAAVPRHPSQLYEFTMGLAVLGALWLSDRLAGRERRPPGLLAGLFLALYFSGRFMVEFVKEYQAAHLSTADSALTMGQYLSLLPLAAGLALVAWSLIKRRRGGQE